MALQPGTEPYQKAQAAMTEILTGRARRKADSISYKDLALLLQDQGHPVHWRGTTISQLLKDLCLQEFKVGGPMLSAIVVNAPAHRGRPSQAFYDLARQSPFSRGENWTWEKERDHVYAHYADAD